MNTTYNQPSVYEKLDFTINKFSKGAYEQSVFINCNFLNVDLSGANFTDCKFECCNMSMAKLANTTLNSVIFKECKLLGLHFDNCNKFLFSVKFENCMLNLASFYKLNIKKTSFINTSIMEVDFTEADLTGSVFDNCDLANSIFDNTILEKVDFRTSVNYTINPEKNKIKKAKFSLPAVIGLLNHYDIVIE